MFSNIFVFQSRLNFIEPMCRTQIIDEYGQGRIYVPDTAYKIIDICFLFIL